MKMFNTKNTNLQEAITGVQTCINFEQHYYQIVILDLFNSKILQLDKVKITI